MANNPLKFLAFLICFLLFSTGPFVFAQSDQPFEINSEANILKKLSNAEFENLRCISKDSVLYLSFENREYRSDAEAIAVVINTLLPDLKPYKKLCIVYLELNLAIIKVEFSIPPDFNPAHFEPDEIFWRNQLNYSYSVREELEILKSSSRMNGTLGKIDLEIEPKIGLQLGDFRTPFKIELFAYPSINLNLWKGGFFHGSAYLHFYNYKYTNKYRYFKPYILSLSQNFRLGNGMFLKFSAGTFSINRIGIDTEWNSWLLNGKLKLGAKVGYTGLFRYLKAGHEGFYGDIYDQNIVEYSMPNYLTYNLSTELRIPKTELAISYAWGRYLYLKQGHNVRIYRNFNEYLMGVQAYWGNDGTNFGFYIYLPLIPSKYYFNKKIRVKPSKYLNYSYLARSDYYYYYRTGYYPDLEYLEVNPQVIMNQLPMYLLIENRNENKQKNKN